MMAVLAPVERLFAGFFYREVDQHFIICRTCHKLELRALCKPARSMAARIALSFGRLGELHLHQRAPAEIDAQGIPCQNSMENTPATLNISEKARKYHFLPRKSMFGLRKNSTLFQAPSGYCSNRLPANQLAFQTPRSNYPMLSASPL